MIHTYAHHYISLPINHHKNISGKICGKSWMRLSSCSACSLVIVWPQSRPTVPTKKDLHPTDRAALMLVVLSSKKMHPSGSVTPAILIAASKDLRACLVFKLQLLTSMMSTNK
eukprot:660588_1